MKGSGLNARALPVKKANTMNGDFMSLFAFNETMGKTEKTLAGLSDDAEFPPAEGFRHLFEAT